MLFQKVGDCLRYGLYHELFNQKEENNNYYLLSALIFLYLKRYIPRNEMDILMQLEVRSHYKKECLDDFFEHMKEILTNCLKRYFEFKESTDIFEVLNNITIPKWIFQTVYGLIKLYPQVYFVEDYLYYLMLTDENYRFRYINVNLIESLDNFGHNSFADWNEEIAPFEPWQEIGDMYSEIIGYNAEMQVFYLKLENAFMYAEYWVETEQTVLHNNRCYGVIGNRYPVIKAGRYLAIVDEKDNNIIVKETDRLEEYSVDSDRIFVTPSRIMPLFFKPYFLSMNGQRYEASYEIAKRFWLNRMSDDIPSLWYGDIFAEGYYNLDFVSLNFLNKLFRENYAKGYQTTRTQYFIVKLLEKYLPKDTDVLDWCFMLSDVSKRLCKEKYYEQWSGDLYRLLSKLHISGQLKVAAGNVEDFRKMLLKTAYWTDERLNTISQEDSEKLGFFEFDREKVRVEIVELEEAACVGNLLIPTCGSLSGIVMYNIETGNFEIQCNRRLENYQIFKVKEAFGIEENCRIIISGIPNLRKVGNTYGWTDDKGR